MMRIVPTGGPLGAYVEGLDASRALDGDAASRLVDALHEHLVLVARDQRLSEAEQVRFTRHFGEPTAHVRPPLGEHLPEIFVISNVTEDGVPVGALGNGELTFHSDLSYLSVPGSISIVHAIEVPRRGGETQWANGYAAYAALPERVRGQLHSLTATHRHGEEQMNPEVEARHPVVRTHPVTRRRATYVNPQFTRALSGLPASEAEELLDSLLSHVQSPEFVWTHRWRVGDLVLWDNRCTMHRRAPFEASARRLLKRTQIVGDAPFLEL